MGRAIVLWSQKTNAMQSRKDISLISIFLRNTFIFYLQRTRIKSSNGMFILVPQELLHYSSLWNKTFTTGKVSASKLLKG